jgi:hypothetical protein
VIINAAYAINQSLCWAKDPAEKNPFSGKYLGHVDPKWLGYGKQNQKVYSELQESIKCHLILLPGDVLKLLRSEQRICQINKQPQTNDPTDDVFPIHAPLPVRADHRHGHTRMTIQKRLKSIQ